MIERAREQLRQAGRVVVFTGAGVSAESGVPTFRGAGGLWKQFRPEELATPQAFARDPRTVWEWYQWRRGLVAQGRPNAAHLALAEWETRRDGITLITQNVDDLHERAGSRNIVKLHGSLFATRCSSCLQPADVTTVNCDSLESLPRCARCKSLLRPGVVWFGESLPEHQIGAAQQAAESADVCLVVGTSGAVYPAAGIVHTAREAGAAIIVIDPGETSFDAIAGVRFTGTAAEIVPKLIG